MEHQEFLSKLKDLRESKGLSQDELARLAGLSLRTIQRIENGTTSPHGDTKRKIFAILDLQPDIDISNSGKRKTNFFRVIINGQQYIYILFIFSIFGIFIGRYINFLGGFLKWSSTIGFLCLLFLVISLAYRIKQKGWKKEFNNTIFTTISTSVYVLILSSFVYYKHVETTTINGVTTKIERNTITGKIDTTVYTRENFPVKD